MRPLRAALRWLDPWVVSLLGVLVALGVVILLATPGPWHHAPVAAPQVRLAPHRPTDVAVFVRGRLADRCTAVLWLHIAYDTPSLTASVVAAPTQGLVNGGGYARIDRLVTDVGPAQAALALGQALGVKIDAWATLDRQALRLAVPTMFPVGDQHAQRRRFRAATRVWAGQGSAASSWRQQYETLAAALPDSPFEHLSIVGFSNYVLGFGEVQSDLDLQGAASLARLLTGLTPAQVYVRAVPAVVERSGRARVWRVDQSSVARLTASLAFGLVPPRSLPHVGTRSVRQAVLVAGAPTGAPGRAYLTTLAARLHALAGRPIDVLPVRSQAGVPLAEAVDHSLDQSRPLAVVVASSLATTDHGAAAADVTRISVLLETRGQPGVVCAPADGGAGDDGALAKALAATPLPVAPAPGVPASQSPSPSPAFLWTAAAARRAARANAATLVRACWPAVLAPRLTSTRIGFSLAAARAAKLTLVAAAPAADALAARLAVWGYTPAVAPASSWQAPLSVAAVYYRNGARRAALALAGDLRLPSPAVMAEPAAPSAVTLAYP